MKIGVDAYEIRYSYEILVNTAEWLIRERKSKSSDYPVAFGRKRNLLNTEPKHRYGDDFRAPKRLSSCAFREVAMEEIKALKEEFEERYYDRKATRWKFPNVIGCGIGFKIIRGVKTDRKAIIVLVKKKVPLEELKANEIIPKTFSCELGGCEVDVVEVGEVRVL